MKRTIAVYGLISGLILAATLSIGAYFMKRDPHYESYGMWVGYGSMLLAFVFIFIAIKSYRDNELGGYIRFGKAFVVGLAVAIIGSLFYTITWAIIVKNFYPNVMEVYYTRQLDQMRAAGKSSAEILKAAKDIEWMRTAYDSWLGLFGFTIMEVLPVGLLVSLIAAAILKRRPVTVAG